MLRQKPNRVVYVHDSHGFGGMELYMLRLIRNLDRERFTPAVLVPGSSDPFRSSSSQFIGEILSEGITLLRPADPGQTRGIAAVKELAGAAKILKRHGTDIVHIHTCRPEGARKATVAARAAGVRGIIRSEHFPPSVTARPATRYLVKPFDWLTNFIVTGSQGDRREQIHLLKRDAHKVVPSYNSVEVHRFNPEHNPQEAKKQLGLDPGLPMIGTVGRLVAQKGHKYLLAAHAEVMRRFGPVGLLLVGEGELRGELEAQAQRLGTAGYVYFTGFQSDVTPYMQATDIAAMPSLFEVFSLSMLEFMALGKPVVASDHSSFKEAFTDGKDGLIVPMQDSQRLAEAILCLLQDKELRERIGRAGLERVRQHFNFSRLAQDIMSLYDRALSLA